ncbi:early nodulin-93-like isoform X1 [Aristolochia californica]|uniref:early nodulin-93-like isoform X1 n=1 Tax=Aristolochia californica TaxID=171875 RepID=UPI0035DD0FA7
MGIPSEMRDIWINRRKTLLIASPEEDRILASKRCQQEGIRQGLKAASIVRVVTAVPTLVGVRVIPWAKANLNHTAQALIISAASIAAYFITADKTILECARKNSIGTLEKKS